MLQTTDVIQNCLPVGVETRAMKDLLYTATRRFFFVEMTPINIMPHPKIYLFDINILGINNDNKQWQQRSARLRQR
jgi:hypothetical protein